LTNATRLAALVFLQRTVHHSTATQWALAWMIACAVPFLLAVILAQRMAGGIAFAPRLLLSRLWEGLTFSVSLTSVSLYNDFDKTILSRNGLNIENGFYTLGYRLIDFATTPMIAIDTALLPRFFQSSHLGVKAVAAKAFRSLGIAAPIGVGIAVLLWMTAPLVPLLAGKDFSQVPQVVRWLSLIPLLRGLHMISGGALTGLGKQHVRMGTQMLVALFNVTLNLWLIPRYGWIAACWTSLASDTLLATLNLSVLTWFRAAVSSSPTTM
jgi:O-antigen/teichoic acid export membrane protein